MEPTHDNFDVEETVAKLITDSTGGAGGTKRSGVVDDEEVQGVVRREMARYLAAPLEKRLVLEQRLRAIATLPAPTQRTTADVAAVGERLGLVPSNVYRLLKRVADHGPVSGLLPGFRVTEKSGAASTGFGSPVDGWIEEAMRGKPDVAIAEISKTLASKAKLLAARDPTNDVVLPGLGPLRRRVHALRETGATGVAEGYALGESLLIDQCPVDLMLEIRLDGELSRLASASATFILDAPSSMILGLSVHEKQAPAFGLLAALDDMQQRLLTLGGRHLEMASAPSTVRWAVPDALLSAAGEVEHALERCGSSIHLEVLTGDWEKAGREIYRHLGARFGPFRLLLSFPTASGLRPRAKPSYAVTTTLDKAREALSFAADERNRRKMESMRTSYIASATVDDPRSRSLVASLRQMLEPVTAGALPTRY